MNPGIARGFKAALVSVIFVLARFRRGEKPSPSPSRQQRRQREARGSPRQQRQHQIWILIWFHRQHPYVAPAANRLASQKLSFT